MSYMSYYCRILSVVSLSLFMGLAGCAGKEAKVQSTPPESPGESLQGIPTVYLEQALHVSTPDGRDVVIKAGRYQVSAAGKDTLRLLSESDNRESLFQATEIALPAKVQGPTAATMMNEENPDQVNVFLRKQTEKSWKPWALFQEFKDADPVKWYFWQLRSTHAY